ncbi:MAG: type IV secretory system conjugative DNA transfer family protein [Leptolyngbya sp. SIO3F4]|nr:type IV secretory system conjugative DNA transfer family protein [Leptolyngbya sp. SIO3F4]
MGLFKKTVSIADNAESLLDKILYKVPGTDTPITWADAVEGTLITGATGSGKSSGPGRLIALSMLRAGFGFCVLCAKPDEKDRWVKYAQSAGREKDVVIFNKASGLQFNFLQYEIKRQGEGAGDIFNVNNALMNLNEQNRQYQSGGSGQNEERFWDNSLRRLISRDIALLMLAGEEVSIQNMRKVVADSLVEEEAKLYHYLVQTINAPDHIDPQKRKDAMQELEEWTASNYFLQVMTKVQSVETEMQQEVWLLEDYWLKEFARLSERSRSIVVESFMGIIEPFMNKGILKSQFATGLSDELLPESIIAQKKIVIVDFPLKEFGLAGLFASIIYKSVFQGAMERRKIEKEDDPRPVCLWVDEYQNFCNPLTDSLFQTTARSSWTATVYITQNINNLYYIMGNNQPQARAKGLLGNLNLKYFASNADHETNKWASEMIGKHFTDIENLSFSKDMDVSKTRNQQLMPRIMPDHFTTFKAGRKANAFKVQAVAFKAGKTWGKEQQNFAVVEFDQRY